MAFGVSIDKNLAKLDKLANNYAMDAKKKKARLDIWIAKITTPIDAYLNDPDSQFSAEYQTDLTAPPSRAQVFFWKGRALDAYPTYNAEVLSTLLLFQILYSW